ncbi:hypothetical protein X975_05509, partial [Stegodyphus mimosarum]
MPSLFINRWYKNTVTVKVLRQSVGNTSPNAFQEEIFGYKLHRTENVHQPQNRRIVSCGSDFFLRNCAMRSSSR